jgi:hypothetical protein
VAGDADSGVSTTTFQTDNLPDSERRFLPPVPSVVFYDPSADKFTFASLLHPQAGSETTNLGGVVQLGGVPATAKTYTPASVTSFGGEFGLCWDSIQGGWDTASFSLSFTSVGPAVPAIGQDLGGLVEYVVHGTLHADCTGEKDSLGHTLAPGNVTVDVAF